jgi:RNA polymerase sigma-70 factor (ECF subfamily)
LANEHDRAAALKRGGGRSFVSFNLADAESRYTLEPAHSDTPEKLFERRWAVTLLEQVLQRLRAECVAAGKSEVFDQLKVFLTTTPRNLSYAQVSRSLGSSQGAVKGLVHRMRRRYRELLREEIGRTIEDQAEVDAEIHDLFELFRS